MYKDKKVIDIHGHVSTPPHFRAAAMNLIALRTAAERAAMHEAAVKQALDRICACWMSVMSMCS